MRRLRRVLKLAVVVCTATGLFSCSASQHKQAAEQAVQGFHEQLDGQRFVEIYRAAHEDFRKSSSEAEMTEFFAAIHRKLGTVQSSTQEGWRVNVTTGGTQVLLTYKTRFTNGPATESFTWIVRDGRAVLLGYNINSRALITG
ncbi:MAG: DUF4019 domain-containing protein [Acidobacteria bacterium]|nr:DUF4019 domain-containing protein [Acidobacteriota bacterium]